MGLGALSSRLCSPEGLRGRAPPVPTELEASTLHPFRGSLAMASKPVYRQPADFSHSAGTARA